MTCPSRSRFQEALAAARTVVARRLSIGKKEMDLGDLREIADRAGYERGRQTPLYQDLPDYAQLLPDTHEVYWNQERSIYRVRKHG